MEAVRGRRRRRGGEEGETVVISPNGAAVGVVYVGAMMDFEGRAQLYFVYRC